MFLAVGIICLRMFPKSWRYKELLKTNESNLSWQCGVRGVIELLKMKSVCVVSGSRCGLGMEVVDRDNFLRRCELLSNVVMRNSGEHL